MVAVGQWIDRKLEVHNSLNYIVVGCFVYVCVFKTWQEISAVGVVLGSVFGFRTWYGRNCDAPPTAA